MALSSTGAEIGFEPMTFWYEPDELPTALLCDKEPRNTFHFLALLSQPYIYIISQNLKNVKFQKSDEKI